MKTHYRFAAAALGALLATGALCGCDVVIPASGTLGAWVAGDMVSITARTEKFEDELAVDAATGSIKLFSGANETVSFQVVVDAGEGPVSGLKVSCGDLATPQGQKIAAKNVSAFRAHPMRITTYPAWYLRLVDEVPEPTEYYDALIPLGAGGKSANVDASGRAVLWVDLHVPRDARPGRYSTTLEIHSESHETWSTNEKGVRTVF